MNNDIEKRVAQLESEFAKMQKAFIVDDEGDRDYSGHRLAHQAWYRRVSNAGDFLGSAFGKIVLTAGDAKRTVDCAAYLQPF